MTTTPDYAGLIERLEEECEATRLDGLDDALAETLHESAAAIRTLLERNKELERELEMWREVKHSSCWKTRAEAAEARVKDLEAAIKVKGGTEHAPTEWAYLKVCEIADKYKARAEAAEAKIAEAMKVIEPFAKAGELFPNVSPGEIEYDQCVYLPAAGDEYALKGSHLRAARVLKENGNGE